LFPPFLVINRGDAINLAPSLRPVIHYPHLLDIDPGPRVEWDFITHLKRVLPGTQYGLLRLKNSKRSKVPISSFRNGVL
jgi:hypothetical protein